MKRKIISIDEKKCNGCGLCVPDCPEGALQIIDGKARLVSDLFCDGLGACIGNCPEGAISIEEREAEPYDEKLAMHNIAGKGDDTIRAHLDHLKAHGADEYYKQAMEYLESAGYDLRRFQPPEDKPAFSCPGKMSRSLDPSEESPAADEGRRSRLSNWPVQMHLVNPSAPHFRGADLLAAADCTAFSIAGFHDRFLKGKQLVIACPKLDNSHDVYRSKLTELIDRSGINTVAVMIMEVPCCSSLVMTVKEAVKSASRKVPVKVIIVSIEGEVIKEEWI